MTPRARMSENERLGCFMLLFPIFWPFIPVVLLCAAIEKIAERYHEWRYRHAQRKASAVSEPVTSEAVNSNPALSKENSNG